MGEQIVFNMNAKQIVFNSTECPPSTDKKIQEVRVLNLHDLSYLNTTESNYLNFVWVEIDTNTFKTFGTFGQTDLNPDNFEIWALDNNQGLDIQRDQNYITVNGGFSNDWKFIIREI